MDAATTKVTQITASFGGTVNLGNYENFKIELSMTAVVDEKTAPAPLAAHLLSEIRELVRDEVKKLASRNTRGWLNDTDVKREEPPQAPAPTLPDSGDFGDFEDDGDYSPDDYNDGDDFDDDKDLF